MTQRLGVHDRRLTVKRLEETGFSSESKCMEVRCRESNKDVIYMKGKVTALHSYLLYSAPVNSS
jgi:magnesium-transporting ATPase (P-type)